MRVGGSWSSGWVGGDAWRVFESWMDGWMDGWMGGWMDGWMNRCKVSSSVPSPQPCRDPGFMKSCARSGTDVWLLGFAEFTFSYFALLFLLIF